LKKVSTGTGTVLLRPMKKSSFTTTTPLPWGEKREWQEGEGQTFFMSRGSHIWEGKTETKIPRTGAVLSKERVFERVLRGGKETVIGRYLTLRVV